jgi:hypothetical protein
MALNEAAALYRKIGCPIRRRVAAPGLCRPTRRDGRRLIQYRDKTGENTVTNERQTRREAKKQPAMTLKEQISAKKSKDRAKSSFLASGKPT